MKIKKKVLPCLLFGVCCAAFAAYVISTRGTWDRTPPRLTVPETALQLSVYAERSQMLQGVTAQDETDGDVSAQVVVESVSDIYDRNKATVTYAAFDSAGNVAKGQRTVEYTDYVSPRFTLESPLIFREGSYIDAFHPIGAVDAIDGSLDDKIKGVLVSGGDSLSEAGLYEVEFRVTNSLGDTARLTLPVEIMSRGVTGRQIMLTDYLVYLKTGDYFDPMDYISSVSRGRPMDVRSDVDTSRPGTYSVTYTDEAGEIYGKTRLIAVVEE